MAEAVVRSCGALAGYFDILGQSEVLRELRTMERQFGDEEYESKALRVVQRLRTARMYFRKAFAADPSSPSRLESAATLSPEQQAEFARLRERHIHGSYFADSFLMMAPILDSDVRYYLLTVHRYLLAAAACQLQCLASGIPLRGGVVIGAGFQVKEAEENEPYYYGPVLVDAHHLESQVAGYSRIVVGHRLLRELGLFRRKDSAIIPEGTSPSVAAFSQEMAERCLSLLRTDTDRNCLVDLSSTELEGLLGRPLFEKARDSARAFADAEWNRHVANGDQVVAGKYALLLHSLDLPT